MAAPEDKDKHRRRRKTKQKDDRRRFFTQKKKEIEILYKDTNEEEKFEKYRQQKLKELTDE